MTKRQNSPRPHSSTHTKVNWLGSQNSFGQRAKVEAVQIHSYLARIDFGHDTQRKSALYLYTYIWMSLDIFQTHSLDGKKRTRVNFVCLCELAFLLRQRQGIYKNHTPCCTSSTRQKWWHDKSKRQYIRIACQPTCSRTIFAYVMSILTKTVTSLEGQVAHKNVRLPECDKSNWIPIIIRLNPLTSDATKCERSG